MSRTWNIEHPGNDRQDSLFDDAYEIVSPVGRGRNSVVYKARHLNDPAAGTNGEIVALKVLVGSAKDPELNVKRMKREAIAMLSCVHRNVIKLRDYVTRGELSYLAMEYAERGDLRAMLDRQKVPLSPELVLRLMVQLLSGLETIHRAGIVHRDIKPENLLLTEDCVIKIADFGIAFLPSEKVAKEEANRGIGTFDYLAPECLEEGISDEGTDVYSSAVTCYQLLTGSLPFSGTTFTEQIVNKMEGRILPVSQFLKSAPDHLDAFLNQALHPDPSVRFRTARDMREAVEALLDGAWQPPAETAMLPKVPLVSETAEGMSFEELEKLDELDPLEKGALREEREQPLPQLGDADQFVLGGAASSPFSASEEMSADPAVSRARRFGLSVRTAAFAVIALFAIAAWAVTRQTSTPPRAASNVSSVPGSHAETAPPVSAYGFERLIRESHAGLLYGMIADDASVSLVSAPNTGKESVIIAVGLPGWQPVSIEADQLRRADRLQLASGGMRISLRLDERGEKEGTELRGTYTEHVSGRTGEWAIW